MFLAYIGLVIAAACAWFVWYYRNCYIGEENRHRFFADYFKDFPSFHNPRTYNFKKKLFEPLHGIESKIPELRKKKGIKILEIGAGTGANLEFFPNNTKLIVVDPNRFFKEILEEKLKGFPGIELERHVATGAENMADIPSNSIDAVVSTLVLCSASEVQKVYDEINRVLVPGGKFFFMEHVLDDKFSLIKILQRVGSAIRFFPFLFDGCRPDKDIKKELEKSSFAKTEIKRFRLDLKEGVPLAYWAVYVIEPHIYGVATSSNGNN